MRALLLCLFGLVTASDLAFAQMKLPSKAAPAPGGSEVRYFTSIDGLMNGNADVVLKETRQGKNRHRGRARRLLPRRKRLRPQGPLRRQPHRQRRRT